MWRCLLAGILGAAASAPFVVPLAYRSVATLAVEHRIVSDSGRRSPVVSAEYVDTLAAEDWSLRQMMRIIDRYDLYPAERKQRALADVADRMRRRDVQIRSFPAIVRREDFLGSRDQIEVSFRYPNGYLAREVTRDLVSLLLTDGGRRGSYLSTLQFLEDQADGLRSWHRQAELARNRSHDSGNQARRLAVEADYRSRARRWLQWTITQARNGDPVRGPAVVLAGAPTMPTAIERRWMPVAGFLIGIATWFAWRMLRRYVRVRSQS